MLWVRISIRARCTPLCDKVCQWLATGRWFSLGPPVFSTNKTDHHDITEILLKVALNTIRQTKQKIILRQNKLTFKYGNSYMICRFIISYGSLINNFLCNQCLISPLPLWVRIPLRRGVLDTTLCDKVLSVT
jgi:hypothetical protein